MLQQTVDKINGYGSLLRLVTPVLVTLSIFMLGWVLTDVRGLNNHFTNHLMHHQDLEVGYERRITVIESNRFTDEDGRRIANRLSAEIDKTNEGLEQTRRVIRALELISERRHK